MLVVKTNVVFSVELVVGNTGNTGYIMQPENVNGVKHSILHTGYYNSPLCFTFSLGTLKLTLHSPFSHFFPASE